MGTGWHKQRALERRAFPEPKPIQVRPRKAQQSPETPAQVAGACAFCGNCCWPYRAPWTCAACGVTYPVVEEKD